MKDQKLIVKQIADLEERSTDVQEIMGKTPAWFVRSGTGLFFLILLLLFIGSIAISYNDVAQASIIITSKNPPVSLVAKNTSKLTKIYVEPNQKVSSNEVLAVLENTADYGDILLLKNNLKAFNASEVSLDKLSNSYPLNLGLGTIQNTYAKFLTNYRNYALYTQLTPQERESEVLKQQLNEQYNLLRKQKDQHVLMAKDLELSKKSYHRNKELKAKGVISEAEFEEASRNYIRDQREYEGFNSAIASTQISIANYTNLLTRSNIEKEEFAINYHQQLEEAYQSLKTEILNWEQEFLIRSPIDGTVTLFDIWDQFQNVEVGETIFSIIPDNYEEIIGNLALPIKNSGKVKIGQKVIVKLDNYPFREWGSLEGEIVGISEVPKRGNTAFYSVYVTFNELRTSYGTEIDFKQEMQGSAEIILEELNILQRLLYALKSILEN